MSGLLSFGPRRLGRLYRALIIISVLGLCAALIPQQQIRAKNMIGAAAPVWSPDGKKIVYSVFHQEQQELVMMDLASGESSLLAANAGEAAWSPDGSRIAY